MIGRGETGVCQEESSLRLIETVRVRGPVSGRKTKPSVPRYLREGRGFNSLNRGLKVPQVTPKVFVPLLQLLISPVVSSWPSVKGTTRCLCQNPPSRFLNL